MVKKKARAEEGTSSRIIREVRGRNTCIGIHTYNMGENRREEVFIGEPWRKKSSTNLMLPYM